MRILRQYFKTNESHIEEQKTIMHRKWTISVPDLVGRFVDYKVRTGGYGSVSEYIRELIRLDQRMDLVRLDQSMIRTSDSFDRQVVPRRGQPNINARPGENEW
jgi:Arc/MetJ-type ribon-helix-helix transcriptional regulator